MSKQENMEQDQVMEERPVEELPQEEAPVQETPETPGPDSGEADALRKALADKEDQYLRLAAEYDNFRKRSQKEKEGIYQGAKSDAVAAFLPVYDNLDRALKQETADEAYKKGVR